MSIKVLIFKKLTCTTEWLNLSLKQQKHLDILEIVECFSSALTSCKYHEPQILLVCLDHQSEIKHTFRQFLTANPSLKIIALTTHPNSSKTKELLANGAFGHIALEHSVTEELITAIEYALNERAYLCREIANQIANESRNSGLNAFSTKTTLGSREETVLRLIAQGHRSKDISCLLHIAPSTVDVHRRNIKRKTGLHKIADLTRYAIQSRLIKSV